MRVHVWLSPHHCSPETVPTLLTGYVVAVQPLSRVRLFCNPMACSLPGSSVHEISQAKIMEQVAISLSRGSS